MEKRTQLWKLFVSLIVIVLAVVLLAGFVGGDRLYHMRNRGRLGPLTREDVSYLNVETPAPSSKDGTGTHMLKTQHPMTFSCDPQAKLLNCMADRAPVIRA